MTPLPALSAKIEAWTREAFEIWGDDWRRINQHIDAKLVSLEPEEKRRFAREAALTLAGADYDAKH